MNRAGHYRRAEELAEEAAQVIARAQQNLTQRREARDDAHLLLRRAMVHATLAAAVDADGGEVVIKATAPPVINVGHPKPGPPRVMS